MITQRSMSEFMKPLIYKGYFACALTNLRYDQDKELIELEKIIIDVCEKCNIDLHLPRVATGPKTKPTMSEEDVFSRDREEVLSSDILIAALNYPSFGVGIEIALTGSAMVPIIMIYPEKRIISRMVLGIQRSKRIIEYKDDEDMATKLECEIKNLLPIIDERKNILKAYDPHSLGRNISYCRKEKRISEEDLANALKIPKKEIEELETKPEYVSDPSLTLLRLIAEKIDVNIIEFILPDFEQEISKDIVDEIIVLAGSRTPPDQKEMLKILRRAIVQSLRTTFNIRR